MDWNGADLINCLIFHIITTSLLHLSSRHGLSRTNLDGLRPLPEKPEDPGPPSTHSTNFNDRLSMSSEFSMESSMHSSPTTTGRFSNEFFNESISSSTGTGENTVTGRSSTYSWGNDDVSFVGSCVHFSIKVSPRNFIFRRSLL